MGSEWELKHGTHSTCHIMNLEAQFGRFARAKINLASALLVVAHTKACCGRPWLALAPHGQAMAHPKAFFGKILGLWTRYFAHMLRKIVPSILPSFIIFGKIIFFI